MGCSTGACTTTTKGCNSNGGCGSGGCNKVNTYDWLGNMMQPGIGEENNIYEIRFKNTRKAFFKNVNRLNLLTGDIVVVESDRGYDTGQISLGGILAHLQMKKRRVDDTPEKVKKIFRLATEEDVDKLRKARSREKETLIRTRAIIVHLKLDMKLSEVEFQGDNAKAIFYYIADSRVDFRELIKVLAGEFKIRVEMKQIGLRHEAGLIGGIGSCGRELCCSTWLTEFKSVGTSAARYQHISLNPMKISGQCGRLKCCLNYELDTYLDALKGIPDTVRLETEIGVAFLQKTDIFKRIMWFSYMGDSNWIPLTVEDVNEMAKLNKAGTKPPTLQSREVLEKAEADRNAIVDFVDVVGQSKPREDKDRKKKKKKKPDGGKSAQHPGGRHLTREILPNPLLNPPTTENTPPQNPNQRPPQQRPNQGPQNRGPRPPGDQPRNNNNRNKNKNRGPRREGPGNNNNQGGPQNPPSTPPPPPTKE